MDSNYYYLLTINALWYYNEFVENNNLILYL
ncbi:MAG: hypothetical protein ACD_4C00018G0002 [uncultured bacterium (gcode 4)]|uniref:Uncharacterized protein n=1 Tax=uncultured bacterium (gcode 4) TaxID=1234023 RepID=K2FW47_9BACT|nr:MAG: hypothetical protein ACD_4C00018G0002 [uncultured bacterium (gcode 4)]